MRVMVIAAAVVLAATGLSAQRGTRAPTLPTVNQVLDKYLTASGGKTAHAGITTLVAKGRLEIPDAGVTAGVQVLQKAPNKVLQVVEFDGGMGTSREGFDGVVGWTDDPQNGVREKAGAELAEARRTAMFPRELTLRQQYPTMTVTGRDPVGGREAIVVRATPAEGAPATLYFDAESGLLVRQVVVRTTPGGTVDVDATFSDYKAVGGIMRAHTVRQITPQYTATIRFTEIAHNTTIDDAVFRKPAAPSRPFGG